MTLTPRSALAGAGSSSAHDGATGVTISLLPAPRTLALLARRGAAAALVEQSQKAGVVLPDAPRRTAGRGFAVVWTGPGQWQIQADDGEASRLTRVFSSLETLCDLVALDDSRQVIAVEGGQAAETLSKMLPIDLHPGVFSADGAAMTSAAGVSVLIWRHGGGFACAVPRSMARSFWDWLLDSAKEYGCEATPG